ncbi:MAG: MaoC family dehydratase [Leptospiraceae bacterium]|nr:MaoC family dehydratase [Leptospiraceae bacterium]MCP5495958.1 MaoC family dehydratase [Leptospiraceae bacterium]
MIYFEDIKEGTVVELGTYYISEEEILDFAMKYDPQPFHINKEEAEKSMYGGLIASGWHTASICMKLYVEAILNKSSSLGSPGIDELRWKRPVRPGDTLSGMFTIIETKPFKKGIGIVKGKVEVKNQDGKTVMTYIGNGMFGRKDPN